METSSNFKEFKTKILPAIMDSNNGIQNLESGAGAQQSNFWNHRPLYWVQVLRWTYAVGLSPLKVTSDGNFIVLTTCKIRQGLQIGIISLHLAFLASTFRNAPTCESFVTPIARLLVTFSDMTKYMSLMYVIWYRREAIQRMLNNSLFEPTLTGNKKTQRKSVSLLRKAWIWLVVLGYPLQAYYVFVRLDMTYFSLSDEFYFFSDPFRTCIKDPGSFSDLSTPQLVFEVAWRIVFSLHMMFVISTDGFLLAIVGSYGEFVDQAVARVQKAENVESEINETLRYIDSFQSSIRDMNQGSEIATSGWFFANLPFHIIRGIPLATSSDQGLLMFVLSRGYTAQFYLAIAVAAFKSSKVTNAVRSWVSKVKRNRVEKLLELNLLYAEANASQDFGLNLAGLGSLNSASFFSVISATVTYTILNYQFNLYQSV